MSRKNNAERPAETQTVIHNIPPVWSGESRILILGTMPSPKSRESGFFYMHPQNRFWPVLFRALGDFRCGEKLTFPNSAPDKEAAIAERRDFLLRHNIALWDVLSCCIIHGAADSTIQQEIPNDFTEIFSRTKIRRVFCTGKTAFALWKKHCASLYEKQFSLTVECLPSTSPANAAWSLDALTEEYRRLTETGAQS